MSALKMRSQKAQNGSSMLQIVDVLCNNKEQLTLVIDHIDNFAATPASMEYLDTLLKTIVELAVSPI